MTLQSLFVTLALCVGLVVGASSSALYFSQNREQQEHLLAVALSTQRRIGRVEDACSQRCDCQYPDLSALRSSLYAPLAPQPAATDTPPIAAAIASSAPRPEPSADELDRAAKAQDLLSAAARAQRWTITDADHLRELMRGLPSEEHRQISFSLVQLVNEGKVRPDEGVDLF